MSTSTLHSCAQNQPRHAREGRATHAPRPLLAGLLLGLAIALSGCGALLLVGGAGTSAIAFATGELSVTEEVALAELHEATRKAVETLRYIDAEATLRDEEIRWRAKTAGGDPVDIRLIPQDEGGTQLRIRIGIFGSETRSRLVLEQIRQSL